MKGNIRHAITVEECSMVIEAKNHAYSGWRRDFHHCLMRDNYSIFRLMGTIMSEARPPIQGYQFWLEFYRRDSRRFDCW